ncbi:hypothetical protein RBG61_09370 [Paludicola sp. MB14-C6]|uniref:hypothetical protein n=1 Tax=Paludihabitans sp. MB14-C6 TaxID=3070656 RepID=UPI0027DC6F6F|nr:hypothetical protein [Paludicola sp. MB14-C6]WMJ22206.1 hypothetical protein RBG61_09370 [Paludicola sp. MB14-C6]
MSKITKRIIAIGLCVALVGTWGFFFKRANSVQKSPKIEVTKKNEALIDKELGIKIQFVSKKECKVSDILEPTSPYYKSFLMNQPITPENIQKLDNDYRVFIIETSVTNITDKPIPYKRPYFKLGIDAHQMDYDLELVYALMDKYGESNPDPAEKKEIQPNETVKYKTAYRSNAMEMPRKMLEELNFDDMYLTYRAYPVKQILEI